MTDDQLAMVDTLSDMALQSADDVRDAAMMLVAAAGNTMTTAFGPEGAQELLYFANSYCAVVTANTELRQEQKDGR